MKDAWANQEYADPGDRVVHKVEKCGKALSKWSHQCFVNVRRDLEKKQIWFFHPEKEALQTGTNFRVRALRDEVNDLLDEEETLRRKGMNKPSRGT